MDTIVSKETIHFNSDELKLCGHLYKPAAFDASKKYPAVISQGSLASIKEQMSGAYARRLAEHGLVSLVFDYGNYGESEGQPRQFENPSLKLRNLQAAVGYLLTLPYVKNVGAFGVCASAGAVVNLVTNDPRVKAFGTAAGMVGNLGEFIDSSMGEGTAKAAIQKAIQARKSYETTGQVRLVPAYSDSDQTAFYYGEVDYYLNEKRGNIKEFDNHVAVMSFEPVYQFNPLENTENVKTPGIIFHSDLCILADAAKQLFTNLKGPKDLIWGTETHFNYYDKPEIMTEVADKVSYFFKEHLG